MNAGHPYPLLIRGEQVKELESTGTILGALPEVNLHRAYIHIEPKSILILYSDGIIERKNRKGQSFGIHRLKELAIQNQNKSAKEIQKLIFNNVFEFGNHMEWEDDATVVVIKRLDH